MNESLILLMQALHEVAEAGARAIGVERGIDVGGDELHKALDLVDRALTVGIGRVDIEEVTPPRRQDAPSLATTPPAASTPVAAAELAPPRTITPKPAPAPIAANNPTTIARPELSVWRARTFGNGPARTAFVPELTRLVTSVKARVRTLRELAKQDGAPKGEDTPASLQQQVDESYAALCEDLEQLNTQVSLLFGSRDRAMAAEQTPPDWARRANSAQQYVETLERSVDELLMHEDLPSKAFGPKSRHPVIVTFSALWDTISAPDGKPSRD